MSSTSKLRGNITHIQQLTLRSQRDSRHVGPDLLEHTRHNHRVNRANMIDQTFRIILIGSGANKILLLQPEVSDLIVLSQPKLIIDMPKQSHSSQRERLIDF